ncbi:MAG: hypothetical protein D8M18_06060 [Bacteroidetes bacterium]|jgi:hypothetical protein|nr:hypothetical protein [Bacteroidota bacterium]MBV6459928.1 hypothetical protein [Flavobacteriales bacterium]GIK69610.1 MAG: hypothetical protein BroJett020_09050 [Bacteroidota bacterium]
MLFKNLSYKGFETLVIFLIVFSVSCAEIKKENQEENVASTEPLFKLYLNKIHHVDIKKNALVVVLQNNCKPCSFESLKFTDWLCDSVKSTHEKYVLFFAKSETVFINCRNTFKDSLGFYQSFGLYSFYDKVYILENNKLIYQNDIITENMNVIKDFFKKKDLQK